MSLWGNTDTRLSAPLFLVDGANTTIAAASNSARDWGGVSMQQNLNNVFLVDTTEAVVSANRSNGIKTPGWNLYKTYGAGRKFVETLVAMKVTQGAAGDLGVNNNTAIEDTSVPDV